MIVHADSTFTALVDGEIRATNRSVAVVEKDAIDSVVRYSQKPIIVVKQIREVDAIVKLIAHIDVLDAYTVIHREIIQVRRFVLSQECGLMLNMILVIKMK